VEGAPKTLGVVPTIGATPVEGVPTLPIGLPEGLEMEGAGPTDGAGPAAGALPGGAASWAKAMAGSAKSADSAVAVNVRDSMRISFLPGEVPVARAVPASQQAARS